MASRLITRAAFAATIGVDRSQVTRWIERGMPVEPDGVDPAAAATWVRRNVDATQRQRRSNGTVEIAQAGAERRIDALDQMARVALRLAIHAVPAVARDAALDAGLSREQAETVFAAAAKRAPTIELAVTNMMEIPENDAEPLDVVKAPFEIGRVKQGAPTLLLAADVQHG